MQVAADIGIHYDPSLVDVTGIHLYSAGISLALRDMGSILAKLIFLRVQD